MISKYFTGPEARQKVDKKVRTKVDFSGVPKGTTGKVSGYYKHSNGEAGLEIKWDLPQILADGFSKDEYEEFIEEL